MRLVFVGDGFRDKATAPALVANLLNSHIESDFHTWKELRLSRGNGYPRKLQFVLFQARDKGFDGIVATVDSDTSDSRNSERLAELRTARDKDRQNTATTVMPAALGEATPHAEAWILDDPKAVREVLKFPTTQNIPSVRRVDPKTCINKLIERSSRPDDTLQLLSEMASKVNVDRCNHSHETGFHEFVIDVRAELGGLRQA